MVSPDPAAALLLEHSTRLRKDRAPMVEDGRAAQRWDRVALDMTQDAPAPPVRHENGFVDVWGVATRVGVFVYQDEDGGEVLENRPHSEVMAADSLASLIGVPFTIQHPASDVNSANARDLTHGWVLDVRPQDGLVWALTRIASDEALQAHADGLIELSCGYSAILDEGAGVNEFGERYDATQREIVYNHLALVDLARAGAVARLHMHDGARVQTPDRKIPAMKRIKITDSAQAVRADLELSESQAAVVALLAPGLRLDAKRSARADLETGEITLTPEGEEPVTLVLPMATLENVMAVLGVPAEAAPAPEMEAAAEMGEEAAAETMAAGMEEDQSEQQAAPQDEMGEEEQDAKGAPQFTADEVQAKIDAARESVRDEFRVREAAAHVFDVVPKLDTFDLQAATVREVFGDESDQAKESRAYADAAPKSERAAGALELSFAQAVAKHRADASVAANGWVAELQAEMIQDGAGPVDAAKKAHRDRISGKATA